MFEKSSLIFFYTETPVHAGTGTSLGIVDLPIQRESHTDLPMLQASGIKGAFRELADTLGKNGKLNGMTIDEIFGPDDGNKHAGSLSFTDAKLLLFPVRSLRGVFVWATSPLLLERLLRDFIRVDAKLGKDFIKEQIPNPIDSKAFISDNADEILVQGNKLILEDFSFEIEKNKVVQDIASSLAEAIFPKGDEYKCWKGLFPKRFVILSDTVLRDFAKLGTQVVARIKINNDTGTVDKGALWYEEALPPETVLYSLALATKTRNGSGKQADEVLGFIQNTLFGKLKRIQFGGNATVGRGFVSIAFAAESVNEQEVKS